MNFYIGYIIVYPMDMKLKPPNQDSIMTVLSVSIAAINNFQPSTCHGVEFDGNVGDTYVNIRRNRDGGFIPAIGTEFVTPQGTAMITNHWGDQCVAEIIEFDEEYLFTVEQGDDIFIQTAEEYIASLADAANRSRDSKVSDFLRILTTPSGAPTKECLERIEAIPTLDSTEFLTSFGSHYEFDETVEVQCDVVRIERPQTRKARRRSPMELEAAMRLRQDELDNDVVDDIYAELGSDDID